jgi:hypothetical protein
MIVSKLRSAHVSHAAAVTGVVVLVTACAGGAGGGSGEAASSSSSAAASSEAPEPASAEELSAALLPAEAFGPDADVVEVSVDEISEATAGGLPPGATVQPESCAPVTGSAQLSPEDFGAIVAQSATSPTTVTVEVLAESEQIDDAVPGFDDVPAECREITVTAADGTEATVTFGPLEVPSLGDASGGVTLTTALRTPEGESITVPSLLAFAVDGQRLVFLQQLSPQAAPVDPAAFTALFEEAFQAAQAG